ncbi:acyl-CoA thioesterase [Speluncibacter jeojiensis]|uniref:acyl-CoA thioesterase n=1 Tax=Speluncibacter jeojiensis TaxID=2710754 RepID=UPI00240F006E|nr:thioesterase family protein [Rhodococcus sp. D2-41]
MPESTPHPFDLATALTDASDGVQRGNTSEAYANMVGPFGGITAATLLRAVQRHPDCLGDPLSLTVNYAAPITDGAFGVRARPVRTNRSTQHWAIELVQDGAVTTTATAVTGIRRDTWSSTEVAAPDAPPFDQVEPAPPLGFIKWIDNYELRFVVGAIPEEASGEQDDSTSTLWVRDQPARPLDHAALTALCDVFYPRVFLRQGRYVPAGTVSLTVYFHARAEELAAQGTEPVLATARAQRFGAGFFDQSAQLFGRNGAVLATSHQLVYFKA